MPAPLVLPAPSPPAPTTTQGSTFREAQLLAGVAAVGNIDNGEVGEGLTHGVNAVKSGTEVKHQHHAVELRGAGGDEAVLHHA